MRRLRISLIMIIWVLLLIHQAFSITIATGSQEGTYYKIAQDIKQIAEKEGIPIEIISTNGSFDNINLLGAGKVDLAILQLDVLKFVSEIMQKEADFNVFEQAKVALNLIWKRFTSSPGMKACSRFISSKAKKSPWARSGAAQL